MDYFHADRRPVWRRSPGPDAFLRRAIPVQAFAQLTYRESLRDIETISVHASKLYHMGFRQPVRRSTLADANERRDWRIHAALAQRRHHPGEDAVRRRRTGVGPDQYRLRPGLDDHRSVPVGLSVGALPHHQGGGEDAHAARPAGQHAEFIHISDGKLHDVHALDMLLPEAGAIYVVDRGYVDFARLYVLHQAGAFFVTRAKSNIDAQSRLFGADGSLDRHHLRPGPSPWTASTPVRITPNFCGASAS